MKTVLLFIVAVLLVALAVVLGYITFDEARLNEIRPGMDVRQVEATLGRASMDLSPVPSGFVFQPPPHCADDTLARLLVYQRGNFRRSLLVYVTRRGRVGCVERRQYMITGRS